MSRTPCNALAPLLHSARPALLGPLQPNPLVVLPAPRLELPDQVRLVLGRLLAVLLAHPHVGVLPVEPHHHQACTQGTAMQGDPRRRDVRSGARGVGTALRAMLVHRWLPVTSLARTGTTSSNALQAATPAARPHPHAHAHPTPNTIPTNPPTRAIGCDELPHIAPLAQPKPPRHARPPPRARHPDPHPGARRVARARLQGGQQAQQQACSARQWVGACNVCLPAMHPAAPAAVLQCFPRSSQSSRRALQFQPHPATLIHNPPLLPGSPTTASSVFM